MNIAIILAAGDSTRMGGKTPKLFISVNRKPLIVYTIEAFQKVQEVDSIVLVTKHAFFSIINKYLSKYQLSKVSSVIVGGKSRQESVYNALDFLRQKTASNDIVLIHDGARPLVSEEIIRENISLAIAHKAVSTVIPSIDTISVSADGHFITNVPNREDMYQTQTPQSFSFGLILKAHEFARENGWMSLTDDASVVLKYGEKVAIASGHRYNFKVTTLDDLILLRSIISKSRARRDNG